MKHFYLLICIMVATFSLPASGMSQQRRQLECQLGAAVGGLIGVPIATGTLIITAAVLRLSPAIGIPIYMASFISPMILGAYIGYTRRSQEDPVEPFEL